MKNLTKKNVLKRGANMVEYLIIVGVVALIAIAGFQTFGGNVKDKITAQGTTVSQVNAH
jgi:pilus assembly protein Flp/PilA